MKKILEAKNIIKNFGPTRALNNAGINLYQGQVMGLVGENGAGKSTIINIISGALKVDSGDIIVDGESKHFKGIRDAEKWGIAVVHQELQLINHLSVAENIFLGRLEGKFGFVNYQELYKKTRALLKILAISKIKATQKVDTLSIAQQQMIEIAKALSLGAKIIILDEPTDALSYEETKTLFQIIQSLKKRGIAFLYVTHRMKELPQITDRVTVFKDGAFVVELATKKTSIDQLISYMIGRELKERFPKSLQASTSRVKYRFENFTNQYVSNITLDLKEGEILALVGLIGSGRTEFAKSIIQAITNTSGKIYKYDQELKIKNIRDAINKGIFYVSENRKLDGLDVTASIRDNIMISSYNKVINKWMRLINYSKVNTLVEQMSTMTKIKMHSANSLVSSLSGGNQQKVLFSKALATDPDLLILDEPTRGVDVGARKEIYKIMRQITAQGSSILMVSSELPEAMGMADRIVVFHEGQLSGILSKRAFNEEIIMQYATKKGGGYG